jgi:hypothetical protein
MLAISHRTYSQIDYTKIPIDPEVWIDEFFVLKRIDSILIIENREGNLNRRKVYKFGKSGMVTDVITMNCLDESVNLINYHTNDSDTVMVSNKFITKDTTVVNQFWEIKSYDAEQKSYIIWRKDEQSLVSWYYLNLELTKGESDFNTIITFPKQLDFFDFNEKGELIIFEHLGGCSEGNCSGFTEYGIYQRRKVTVLIKEKSDMDNSEILPRRMKKIVELTQGEKGEYIGLRDYYFNRFGRLYKIKMHILHEGELRTLYTKEIKYYSH